MTFHLMFRNLSGLHCCLFVKVLLLLLSSNLFILAQVLCFVNNFFQDFLFFSAASLSSRSCRLPWKTKSSFGSLLDLSRQSPLASYQMFSHLSTPFFKKFSFSFSPYGARSVRFLFQLQSLTMSLASVPFRFRSHRCAFPSAFAFVPDTRSSIWSLFHLSWTYASPPITLRFFVFIFALSSSACL